MAECFAAMDVFALSSRNEGLPNVVLEAMASGVPCVVTDVGDSAAVVGRVGVTVPKEDAAALAEGMKRLATLSETERATIGRRSLIRVQKEFSMERCVDRFEAVYLEVLGQG